MERSACTRTAEERNVSTAKLAESTFGKWIYSTMGKGVKGHDPERKEWGARDGSCRRESAVGDRRLGPASGPVCSDATSYIQKNRAQNGGRRDFDLGSEGGAPGAIYL